MKKIRSDLGGAIAVAVAVTAARMAYAIWWSPYELVADEAQYWDWSRHLQWSYYSKGPGIAWLIALTRRVLGDAEWAIRVPAALAMGVVMVAAAWLAREAAEVNKPRAALCAASIVALVPAYQLSALLMTIDAPYLACWAVALCAGWHACEGERRGAPRVATWLLLGALVGIGFLFKYTALLVLPGVVLFAARAQRADDTAWRWRALWSGLVALAIAAPVVVWNVQRHGAGIVHLLGYLHLAGGDRPVAPPRSAIRTMLEYPLTQLAVVGPMLLLAAAAGRSRFSRYAVVTALPMLLVFAVASVMTRIEANWPIAAFLSVVPLAAVAAADRRAILVWRAAVVYGVIALAAIHAPLIAARAPVVGTLVPTHRFHGHRDRVGRLASCVHDFVARTNGRGVLVATSHNDAALLAYYLPTRPVVASAGWLLGNRPSAYDFFDQTDLRRPAIATRPWLLLGSPSGCVEFRPAAAQFAYN